MQWSDLLSQDIKYLLYSLVEVSDCSVENACEQYSEEARDKHTSLFYTTWYINGSEDYQFERTSRHVTLEEVDRFAESSRPTELFQDSWEVFSDSVESHGKVHKDNTQVHIVLHELFLI